MAGGQWQVSLSGKLLTVTANVPLKPGAVVRAVVEQVGGRVLLRVVPDSLQARLAQTLGLPESPELGVAIAALMRSHMALSSEQITSVFKALVRLRRQDAGSARVLAMLHDRGLKLTADQVEELLLTLEGVQGWGNGGGSSRGRDFGDPGGRARDRETFARIQSPRSTRDAVGGALRYFCGRTTEIGDHLLQLFNHVSPLHERWLVIPFGYALSEDGDRQNEVGVNGSLRLLIAGQRADRARLYVQCAGGSWLFGWNLNPGGPETRRMEIHTDSDPGRRETGELFATVRKLGFIPPPAPAPLIASDGFSVGDGRPDLYEVNESL